MKRGQGAPRSGQCAECRGRLRCGAAPGGRYRYLAVAGRQGETRRRFPGGRRAKWSCMCVLSVGGRWRSP